MDESFQQHITDIMKNRGVSGIRTVFCPEESILNKYANLLRQNKSQFPQNGYEPLTRRLAKMYENHDNIDDEEIQEVFDTIIPSSMPAIEDNPSSQAEEKTTVQNPSHQDSILPSINYSLQLDRPKSPRFVLQELNTTNDALLNLRHLH